MNEGALALKPLVERDGATAVGLRVGLTEGGIRKLVKGGSKPTGATRHAFYTEYGIPKESWLTPAAQNGATKAPVRAQDVAVERGHPKTRPETKAASARDVVRSELEGIQSDIEAAQARGAGARELAQLRSVKLQAARLYARLAGENEISEAAILRSSAWGRIMKVMRVALEKCCTNCVVRIDQTFQELEELEP